MRQRLRLLRYAAPHKRSIVVMLATLLVSAALGLLTPWPTKILVDNVLSDKPLPDWLRDVFEFLPGPATPEALLLWAAAATFAIFILGAAFETVSSVESIRLGQKMTYALAADVFMHLQRLSLRFHSRRPVGDTMARTNADTFAATALVSHVAVPVLRSLVTLVSMLAIMYALSPALTLLAVCVIPLQVAAMVLFGRAMRTRSRRRLDLEGRMMSVVEQSLTSVPVVQAFTREEIEHRRFRRLADTTVAAYVSETVASMSFKAVVGAITAFGSAAVLFVGGKMALDGTLTAGTVLVFLAYLASLYGPLDDIAFTASSYQQVGAQADRVLEVLDSDPEVAEQPGARMLPPVEGHVVLEDVSFGYEPGEPVLRNVSLEARPGEIVAIVGPTGAGKSTLVSLLLRLHDPDAGRVLVDGNDLREVRLRSLRQQVAIVLQDAFILPLTVRENITYGWPRAGREQVEEAARQANAHDFIMRLPDGYDTVVGQRGSTLSGGEQQRLAIARAFLKDAPILVLDEPTSALDARTEGALLEALGRLSAGRTSFVIAHRLSTIRSADQILVMDRGEIVERGSHEELMQRGALYPSLYRQQMNIASHEQWSPAGPAGGGGLPGR